MAAPFESLLAVNMLLSVFSHPGDSKCPVPALIANIPEQIEALSGSCLQVPCSFNSTSNLTNPIYALWLTPEKKAIFDSSGSVNLYSLKMIGNLSEKNCTTLFPDLNSTYEGTYFLRIINWPFRATAECHPLQIKVRDSPWSPSLNISGDLEENQSVTVTCLAFTPCPDSPPQLTWNLQQHSLRQTEKNPDGTFTTKIQETVTLSDAHDGYSIGCSAGYPANGGNKTAETEVTLRVSYVPRNTSASVSPSSGLVSAGSRVELSCSSRAWPRPSFTWFRVSRHGGVNVSVGSVHTFNATQGGEFYCVAANRLGQGRSSVISIGLRAGGRFVPITVGTSVAVFLIVCLLMSVCGFRSIHPTPQLTRSQTCLEADVQKSVVKANETEGELHYGEVNIIRKRADASSSPAQDSNQQETVYAEVKGSMPENSSTQSADSLRYATVK